MVSFIVGSLGGSSAAGYQTILDQWPLTNGDITPISGTSGRVSGNFSKNLSNTYDSVGDDSDVYSQAFNFNNLASGATEGANALKLDEENVSEMHSETASSQVTVSDSLQTQEVVLENKEEESDSLILENEHQEEKISNGLENFEIEDDTPELFNSETNLETEKNDQEFSSFEKVENKDEEEDLEIPAFLRRQKN